MELNGKVDEVIMPIPTRLPDLTQIKEELDDYDFEPFHENIFRTLSANFDNSDNIYQIDEAFEKLENCLIENNILNKNGVSKCGPKANEHSSFFLKYRDIDDAFVDMVITEANLKSINNDQIYKRIDLKPFKDNIFSVNFDDLSQSDEENISKSYDSDGIAECEMQISNSVEKDFSDCETSLTVETADVPGKSCTNVVKQTVCSSSINEPYVEDVSHLTLAENKKYSNTGPIRENSYNTLENTIRDVRIMVKKLPSDHSDNEETDLLISYTDHYTKSPTTCKRQVARKKTGGIVTHNGINRNLNESNDQKVIHQFNSKDGDIVPNVFDKMTRAGKRDFQRILVESTANRVIQKTSELVYEKIKQYQVNGSDPEADIIADDAEESAIHKTAELVTNTIVAFLTKGKVTELDELGKEISDEIASRMNSLKPDGEGGSTMEMESLAKPILTSAIKVSPPENKVNKLLESKTVKEPDDDPIEECSFMRTRGSARLLAARKKQAKNSLSKGLVDVVADTNKGSDTEFDEPRRPETRQSKLKQKENLKKVAPKVIAPAAAGSRSQRPRRKGVSYCKQNKRNRSGKKRPVKTTTQSITDFNTSKSSADDSSFSVSESDLSGTLKNYSEQLLEDNLSDTTISNTHAILKASADSTTSEIESFSNITDNCDTISDIIPPKEDMKSIKLDLEKQVKNVNKVTDCFTGVVVENDNNVCSTEGKLKSEIGGIVAFDKCSSEVVHSIADKKNTSIDGVSDIKRNTSFHQGENVSINKSISETITIKNISSDSTENFDKENKEMVNPSSNVLNCDIASEVLNDIITYIEKTDCNKTASLFSSQESIRKLWLASSQESFTDSLMNNIDVCSDDTNLLNYSVDDSFRLFIDETYMSKDEDNIENKSLSRVDFTKVDAARDEVQGGLKLDESAKSKETKSDSNEVSAPLSESKTVNDVDCKNPVPKNSKLEELKREGEVRTVDVVEKGTDFLKVTDGKAVESIANIKKDSIQKDVAAENKLTSVSKPMTNEEKIAQLTKRDPRLLNEKKIVNVFMRDPRIRNKIPKTEEKAKQVPPPLPDILESPQSPDPELPTAVLKVEQQIIEEKNQYLKEQQQLQQQLELHQQQQLQLQQQQLHQKSQVSQPKLEQKPPLPQPQLQQKPQLQQEPQLPQPPLQQEPQPPLQQKSLLTESTENIESNKKKKVKKAIDEELLYKTPLSDLHETKNAERSSYERNKKKRPPLVMKEREINDDNRSKRNREIKEVNDVGRLDLKKPPTEENLQERYKYHESCNDRNVKSDNNEEGNRMEDNNSDGMGSSAGDAGFKERDGRSAGREQDNPSSSREPYEQYDTYARRQHKSTGHDRRNIPDSQVYSRRDFYRRNKFTHDHDHFSSSTSRFNNRQQGDFSLDRQQESHTFNRPHFNNNQFYAQQDSFGISNESLLRASAFPPISLLPDPGYSNDVFGQSFGNMDAGRYSLSSDFFSSTPLLKRSPSPDRLKSPPLGRSKSPDEREYEEYNRTFLSNYDRDERCFRGRSTYSRDNEPNGSTYCDGDSSSNVAGSSNYRYGSTSRDYYWNEDSPPRKRFAAIHNDENLNRKLSSTGRPPTRSWSKDRSKSPPPPLLVNHPWDSPSPPHRWRDNYRVRGNNYHYNR